MRIQFKDIIFPELGFMHRFRSLLFEKMTVEIRSSRHHDPLGKIFEIEKKRGHGDVITFISHYESVDLIDDFSHQKCDGLAALQIKLLRELKADLHLPTNSLKHEIFSEKIKNGFKSLKQFFPQKTKWNNLNVTAAYDSNIFAWRVLTRGSTKKILVDFKHRGISLNSGLLYYLSRVIAEEFLAEDEMLYRWLLPVNLREDSIDSSRIGNHTGSLPIVIDKALPIDEIEQVYKRNLSRTSAKVSFFFLNLVSRLPDFFLNRVLSKRHKKVFWLGSFSNLGVWDVKETSKEFGDPLGISFCPPAGTPNFPIAVGVITFNGQLSICLRLHPALSLGGEKICDYKKNNLSESIYLRSGQGSNGSLANFILDRFESTLREFKVL